LTGDEARRIAAETTKRSNVLQRNPRVPSHPSASGSYDIRRRRQSRPVAVAQKPLKERKRWPRQVAFIQQGGKNQHDHICQSLELFAREVLPEFDAREEARAKVKQEVLAPFIEQAMMRKEKVVPLADDKIPSFVALGRQVAVNAPQLTPEQEAARRRMLAAAQIPLENPEKTSAAPRGPSASGILKRHLH
jgi:hypothetical protein